MDTHGAMKDHSALLTCTSQQGGGGRRGRTCFYPEHQAISLMLGCRACLFLLQSNTEEKHLMFALKAS